LGGTCGGLKPRTSRTAASLAFHTARPYAYSLSHFPRPEDPSKTKPIPETPRWQKRHLGLAAAVVVFAILAGLAWRFSRQPPAPLNGDRPALPTQP
jgi:hypothetical protein